MLIKQSTIFKVVIFAVSLYVLGYLDLFMPPNNELFRPVTGSIAIILAVATFFIKNKGEEYKKHIKFVNLFFMFYIPIILVTAVLSVFWYKYKLASLAAIVMPYFYPLYAYPLVYIFSKDKSHENYLRVIVGMVVVIMGLKAVAWYLYNFQHITIFPNVLLKHSEGWVRNGVLRVDVGGLYGVAICYTMTSAFVKRNRKAAAISIGLALFSVFITQYRYLEIVILLVALLVYLVSTDSDKKKLIRILLLAGMGVAFILAGGLDMILASFSVENKDYGSSNEARIITIDYFWSIMEGIQYIVGLGMLYTGYSPQATALLTRSSTLTYWLEDIGILGGFFMFGYLSFIIYGTLFYHAVKSSILSIKDRLKDRAYLTSITGYMIMCCIMLNILDRQRIFDTSFYIAIISYISAQTYKPRLKPPIFRRLMDI